jgi:hypothetical protein
VTLLLMLLTLALATCAPAPAISEGGDGVRVVRAYVRGIT